MVYGPGQRPDMFCHQAPIKTLAGKELRVWRWQRDFTFVEEVCLGAANAVSVPVSSRIATYNLGSGCPIDVDDFLSAVESVTGRTPKVVFGPPRPCEPAMTYADTTRSRADLRLPLAISFPDGLMAQYLSIDIQALQARD